jgi:hypothetical protein
MQTAAVSVTLTQVSMRPHQNCRQLFFESPQAVHKWAVQLTRACAGDPKTDGCSFAELLQRLQYVHSNVPSLGCRVWQLKFVNPMFAGRAPF